MNEFRRPPDIVPSSMPLETQDQGTIDPAPRASTLDIYGPNSVLDDPNVGTPTGGVVRPDITAPGDRKPTEVRRVAGDVHPTDTDRTLTEPTEAIYSAKDDPPSVRTVELEPVQFSDDLDAYDDLDELFPSEVRERVAAAALKAAVDAAADITEEVILVSGFDIEPTAEGMAETDAYKLAVQSAVPKRGVC